MGPSSTQTLLKEPKMQRDREACQSQRWTERRIMHNITVTEQQNMGCLKEVQVLRKDEKMHGFSESSAIGTIMIY